MASPFPLAFSAPAGHPLAVGREIYPHASLDLIAAAPANSWVQLNVNTFQDAWSPADSRWMTGSGSAEGPDAIMRSWASIGWDSKRSRAVLFGGGHANSWANEIYVWSAYTREWSHAFYCTDMVTAVGRPVDGNNSPVSSHTYSNNFYLPILDRFFTGGGAAQPGGTSMYKWDGDSPAGFAGGWTLDLALAGQGFVGGVTGSNCQHGALAGVDLPGARAWRLRDFTDGRLASIGPAVNPVRIEHGVAWAAENGHDVLYMMLLNAVFRLEFVDDNQANDVFTQMAAPDPNQYTNGAVAYDPVRKLFAVPTGNTTARRLNFVDMKQPPNLSAEWPYVASYPDEEALGYLGTNGHHKYCGFVYYPPGACFVYWYKGRQPWLIHPPEGDPTPTTGWTLTRPTMDTGTSAPPETETDAMGVCGKFRYAEDLRCCIAIRGDYAGNVWALKLADWTDPRIS